MYSMDQFFTYAASNKIITQKERQQERKYGKSLNLELSCYLHGTKNLFYEQIE